MNRVQISTSVSQRTRDQANELIIEYGYSLRDVITLGIEKLYQERKPEKMIKFSVGDRIELIDEPGFPKGEIVEILDDRFYAVRLDDGQIVETNHVAMV